ncbi:MAG: hypothetical protein PARBA_00402 [Parabacteroides sp.]
MCQKSILGNTDYADKAQIYADYLLKKQGLRKSACSASSAFSNSF